MTACMSGSGFFVRKGMLKAFYRIKLTYDNITYPISTPKTIKKFVFNDIPDINALTYGIISAFDFGRDYLHSFTEQEFEYENYKFTITYDSDSCSVEVVCEIIE